MDTGNILPRVGTFRFELLRFTTGPTDRRNYSADRPTAKEEAKRWRARAWLSSFAIPSRDDHFNIYSLGQETSEMFQSEQVSPLGLEQM